MSWLKIEDIPHGGMYLISFAEDDNKHFSIKIEMQVKKLWGLYKTYEEVGNFSIKYKETQWRDFAPMPLNSRADVLNLLRYIGIKNNMSNIHSGSPGPFH